jgi:hypothetical protein
MNAFRIVTILGLSLAPAFAANWSGVLVDSKCYEAEVRNVNPTDTDAYVDTDRNMELRFCTPRDKTKLFSIVLPDGTSFRLDASGNAKAADLIRGRKAKTALPVSVTGEVRDKSIQVSSISLSK